MPQTHMGSPRRKHKGKTMKPEREQVSGLFSALQFIVEMATRFPLFNHLITPPAFLPHATSSCSHPKATFLTLTTCRVLVMKAFLIPSSVASRLNFRGFASTMRRQRVKESPLAVLGMHTDTQTHRVPQWGPTKQPLCHAFSQNCICKVWNPGGKSRHGRNVQCSTCTSVRFLSYVFLVLWCCTVLSGVSVQMNTREKEYFWKPA